MNENQKAFLNSYLAQCSAGELAQHGDVIAEYYCADEYNANECARLVKEGIKTASCSLKQGYEIENEPLPKPGRLTVVLNWNQEPVCIVKLVDVTICPFNQVSKKFAEAEGEGDGTYEWWRQSHMAFFTKYAEEVGAHFDESSDLVLERFIKVYPQ